MSTKRLARTPLEAGHYNGKNQRRNGKNHAPRNTVRAKERAVIGHYQDEFSDTHVDEPTSRTQNADKLGALKGWLLKQCGRPWDKVFSEIAEKFDFRTMAGRHILQHVKGYVDLRQPHQYRRWSTVDDVDYYYPTFVNDAGILMRNKHYMGGSLPTKNDFTVMIAAKLARVQKIEAWAAGRSLGREGALLFWYEITTRDDVVWCEDKKCMYPAHPIDSELGLRYHTEHRTKAKRLQKLTKDETAFFTSLPPDDRPRFNVDNGFVKLEAGIQFR